MVEQTSSRTSGTSGTSAVAGPGSLVMPTLHSFFRREVRLAGGVVRAVAPGDRARSAVVADHVDFVVLALHHHHGIEDDLIWPRLLERVPDELAPVVRLMQSQHERIDAVLTEIEGLLPAFRRDAGEAERDRIAELCDSLSAALTEHLDAEEERLVPIADRTLTAAEWDEIGERGRAGTPRGKLSLVLGMYQYEGSPAAIAHMLAEAPPPVRWVVPRLSRRAFRRYALRVHGTTTP